VLENRVDLGGHLDAEHLKSFAGRVLLPVVLLLGVMIGLGQAATHLPAGEDGINRWFAAHRGDPFNGLSWFFSFVGSTPCIIGVTAIVAFILLRTLHRWAEPLFLCSVVTAQAIVFFFTTLVIDRERPDVPRMDDSPPTSSFPSGHTSAAFALYAGLALLLSRLVHRTWAKWLCWLLVLMPVGVAVSRLYRGMHHPTDVTASFFNGTVCIVIMALFFRPGRARRADA
jgi:membrane-associated phospholipid phosphatase